MFLDSFEGVRLLGKCPSLGLNRFCVRTTVFCPFLLIFLECACCGQNGWFICVGQRRHWLWQGL